MDKAKQRALEAYPKRKDGRLRYYNCTDDAIRRLYARGYRKAEKDLALTWEDMQKVVEITMIIDGELVKSTDGMEAQEYWEETLRRFNEQREKK